MWSLLNTYRYFLLPGACSDEEYNTTFIYYKLTVYMLTPFGAMLGCILISCIFYMPYYFCQCFLAYRESTADEREKRNMLNNLMCIDYDVDLFRCSLQDCSICSYSFQQSDQQKKITPLPCNKMHIFHTSCIKPWLQQKSKCPICRTPITSESCK